MTNAEIRPWLPLAIFIANKYAKYYAYDTFDDAYQEACIGLVKALRSWKRGTEGKSAYLARGMKLAMLNGNRKKRIKTGTLDTGLIETLAIEDDTKAIIDRISLQQAAKALSSRDRELLQVILKNDVVFHKAAEEAGICKQRLSQIWKRMQDRLQRRLS